MPARPKGFDGLALIEKDTCLAVPHGELGAPFDFTGALFGNPMDQLLTGFVKPLNVFEKNEVVHTHVRCLLR